MHDILSDQKYHTWSNCPPQNVHICEQTQLLTQEYEGGQHMNQILLWRSTLIATDITTNGSKELTRFPKRLSWGLVTFNN